MHRAGDWSENVILITPFCDPMGSSWDFDNIKVSDSLNRCFPAATWGLSGDEINNRSKHKMERSECYFPMDRSLGVWPSNRESGGVEIPTESQTGYEILMSFDFGSVLWVNIAFFVKNWRLIDHSFRYDSTKKILLLEKFSFHTFFSPRFQMRMLFLILINTRVFSFGSWHKGWTVEKFYRF